MTSQATPLGVVTDEMIEAGAKLLFAGSRDRATMLAKDVYLAMRAHEPRTLSPVDMVERVARALSVHRANRARVALGHCPITDTGDSWKSHVAEARAAIAAISTPLEDAQDVGADPALIASQPSQSSLSRPIGFDPGESA